MDLSVVILTWNSEKYIEKCLKSVIVDAAASNLDYEIFIVDNGSADATKSIIRRVADDRFHLIALEKNLGTTVSRNLALRQCTGSYILLLDSDTEIQSGSISKLIDSVRTEPQAGLVCPRLIYPDGGVQKSFQKFPTFLVKFAKLLRMDTVLDNIDRYDLYDDRCYQSDWVQPFDIDWSFSATWIMPKETIDQVGLLDENIFYSPEDVDYCLRIWKSGLRVIHNPGTSVIHNHQRISHKHARFTIAHTKGLFYLFRKHGYCLSRTGLYSSFTQRRS